MGDEWKQFVGRYASADQGAQQRMWSALSAEQQAYLANTFGITPPPRTVNFAHEASSPPAVEKPPKKNHGVLTCGCLSLVGLFVVLAIVGNLGGPPSSSGKRSSSSRSSSAGRSGNPTQPAISSVSFQEIRSNMENMTEIQFKRYVDTLEGKRIRWTGWVENVDEKVFGGYSVQVDMDPPSELVSVQDVEFDVSESVALRLRKDSHITFSGTISSVLNILSSCQVRLEDATVH